MVELAHEVWHCPDSNSFDFSRPNKRGDAYRAGLIFGLMRGMDWPTTGRIASLMGTLKIEHPGTQNQRFTYQEFADQFKEQFGYSLS